MLRGIQFQAIKMSEQAVPYDTSELEQINAMAFTIVAEIEKLDFRGEERTC